MKRRNVEVLVVWTGMFLATGCVVLDVQNPDYSGYFVSARTYVDNGRNSFYYSKDETLFHFSDSVVQMIKVFAGELRDNSFRLEKLKSSKNQLIYFCSDTDDAFVINRSRDSIQLYKYDKQNWALIEHPYRSYQGLTPIAMDQRMMELNLARLNE